MFRRYALRTTDVEAARAFYREVAALEFTTPSGLELWPLHAEARARGAPPHWLGMIVVEHVERSAEQIVERGGERLGPTTTFAAMRDPSGAVFAIRAGMKPVAHPPVDWHHLNANELGTAWAFYGELLGWHQTSVDEDLHVFAWPGSTDPIGSISKTARQPGMHPHWLFGFPVDDLPSALERVRAGGGKAVAKVVLPTGKRLAACEDPQGAMFGLTA